MQASKTIFKSLILIILLTSPNISSQDITWQQTKGPYGGNVFQLVLSPNGSIIAVSGNSLFKTTNNGTNWAKLNYDWINAPKAVINSNNDIYLIEDGNFNKSTDGGITWSSVTITSNNQITDLTVNPQENIYAAIGNKVYYSTNSGTSWNSNSGNIPVTLIKSISTKIDSNYFIATDNGVFRSTDKGNNWNDVTGDLPSKDIRSVITTNQGKIFIALSNSIYSSVDSGATWSLSYFSQIDFFNFLTVDLAGNIWASTGSKLMKSSDGGNNWIVVKPFSDDNLLESVLFKTPNLIFAGCENGVFLSTDNGVGWVSKNNGLVGTKIDDIFTTGGKFFITALGDIFITTDRGNTWNSTNAKSFSAAAVASTAKDDNGTIYFGDYGGFGFSKDYGKTWTRRSILGANGNVLSMTCGQNGKVFAITSNKIFRSFNSGDSWEDISTFPLDSNLFKIVINKSGYLFGIRKDGIYRSSDNGTTWNKKTQSVNGNIQDIIITHKGSILASSTVGIIKSADNGNTWTTITNGIIPGGINSLFEGVNGRVYANNLQRLLYSVDDGNSWNLLDDYSARKFIADKLQTDKDGYLYSTTSSKGVYRSSVPFLKILPPVASVKPGDQKAYISWTKSKSTNFAGYKIYGSPNHYPAFYNGMNAGGGVNDTTKVISGLTNNIPYYFVVSAIDNDGNEAFSEEVSVIAIPTPSIPQLISIANKTKNVPKASVNFVWHKCSYASSYKFQLATDSLFSGLVSNDSTLADTVKQVRNLLENTKYYWHVNSKGISGRSKWSETWTFTTVVRIPDKPITVKPLNNAVNLSINQRLQWKSAPRAEQYYIQVSKKSDFSNLFVNDSTAAGDTLYNIEAEYGTKYYWRVKAANISGSSLWTTTWNFTTIIAPPGMPELISPSNDAANISTNDLFKWKKAAGAEKYYFQVWDENSIFIVNDSLVTDSVYRVNPMAYYTNYFWRVKAKNFGGESNWTETWKFKTIIGYPNTPYLYQPNNDAVNQPVNLVLKWFKLINVDKYHLQISATSEFKDLIVNDSTVTDTLKQITLENNKVYYWRLSGINIGGASEWSEVWKFKTIVAVPGVPNLLTPADGSKNQAKDIQFTWSTIQDADTYRFQLSDEAAFSRPMINDSALAAISKDVSGLKEGMKYYWRVNAKNAAGTGSYSPQWNFITLLPSPEVLSAVSLTSKKVNLNWKNNTDNEIGFILERNKDGESEYKLIDSIKVKVSSYNDSTVLPATTYKYRLKAYTLFASSDYSNEVSVTTLTGINEAGVIPTVYNLSQNYPNPFNPVTSIYYQIPKQGHVTLKIYDILGREVRTLVDESKAVGKYVVEFNASDLGSGTYIYEIKVNDYRAIKKLVLLK